MAPAAAAPLLQKSEVQAYVGADPFSDRRDPADLRSVESFGCYVVITFNPAAPALSAIRTADATRRAGSPERSARRKVSTSLIRIR